MKAALRNRHQKAAYRPGERRVSRAQVRELLELASSDDAEERLVAAKFLCPCHVRGRDEEIWETVLTLMGDDDPRVRFAAWHTLEDGGVPREPGVLEMLEARLGRESDPGVLGMARFAIGPLLAERDRRDLTLMRRQAPPMRGKCDFCGERDVAVERDFETLIPTADLPRPALICQRCAAPAASTGRVARRS
jgi:hypothetical protein